MAGANVRVEPPFVEFNDVTVGRVYRMRVSAHNVGKTSTKIRMEEPVSQLFRFTTSGPDEVVAPGLSVAGLLEFTPQEELEVRDHLIIHVDEKEKMKILLLGIPKKCFLQMDPIIDFGCLVVSGKVIKKSHPITNQGSASGVFQIQLSGASSLNLSPLSGAVAAGSTQWLNVELLADAACLIDEKAEVKLENRPPVALSIKAKVVEQHLDLFDLQANPLSSLSFGPVYFGTSRVENVVLRNDSPQWCDWVCLLQEAAGTETGTAIQKSTNAALVDKMKKSGTSGGSHQVLACVPNQGRLAPYNTTTVAVHFTPLCKKSGVHQRRVDYCLFLLFESVGSKHCFSRLHAESSAELAVTGSGLPVSLVPHPSERFDFPGCEIGPRVEQLCVLKNLCSQLPIRFSFRKVAHFVTEPSTGSIAPGQSQDVVLSFNARQLGRFQVSLKLDVLGHVTGCKGDSTKLELSNFHTITLHLSAVCQSGASQPVPQMSSDGRIHPCVRVGDLSQCRGLSRVAVLRADKTRLHRHRRTKSPSADDEEFLAFPNDRALSIRPSSPTHYRTIFTGVSRYCYVDTTYAFTRDEKEQRKKHQQIYADFNNQLRRLRTQKLSQRREDVDNDVDIGLVPAQGLLPPKLRLLDVKNSKILERTPHLLHSVEENEHSVAPMEASIQQQSLQTQEFVKAVPSTSQEVAECSRNLTPQELYRVGIGPSEVDFGDVCVQSLCVGDLLLINPLSVHVWVQLHVDLPELRGSSPLSLVLPPHSQSTSSMRFQSDKLGHFCKPFSYSINGNQHLGQFQFQARVVPLTLKLSTERLTLRPTPGLLVASGYRGYVTLRNQYNHPAEFTWKPVVTEKGILFSIRPATGSVEPYRELDCEVVWHPSYSAPSEGDFDLCVHGGNTQRLHCVAKVGTTRVQFAEKKKIPFRGVPLNRPSVRTAVMHNTGSNHAFYKVACALPGMLVSPPEGAVPSRGQTILHIHYTPDWELRFDATVEIALRNMKSIEFRVGGSVEPPSVNISVSHFQFHGVYSGSRSVLPFTLTNQSSAAAHVTFDLSEYKDFSLQLPRPDPERRAALSVVEIREHQTMDCSLVFSPTEICSRYFYLPFTVNGVKWRSTSESPLPRSSSSSSSSSLAAGSRKYTVKSVSDAVSTPIIARQAPFVQATVLCAPVEMRPPSLQFYVHPQSDSSTKEVQLEAAPEDSVCWKHTAEDHVSWRFDVHTPGPACTTFPSSGTLRPGQSVIVAVTITTASESVTQLSLPLYLGETREENREPYRELSITLQRPNISIHPPRVLLPPVPLRSSGAASLTLTAAGYSSGTSVSAEVDDVRMNDGTKMKPVTVAFPQGNTVPAQDQHEKATVTSLLCDVAFCLDVPVSFWTTITFTDHLNNRFKAELCAITDNCLLTVWPYLALHYSEQQIVLKTGPADVEALVLRRHTPTGTATSSSLLEMKSSTLQSSSDIDSKSEKMSTDTEESCDPQFLGVPQFPAAHAEAVGYHQRVLLSVEGWFSLFGWPCGPNPITIPHTLRRISLNKDSKSVIDMLHHLTGIQIPGVAHCQTFSTDLDQRTNQLLQQHEATLSFLRVQGAHLCHIRPEHLLDELEFEHWCSLQTKDERQRLNYSGLDYESLSKRSWTDVLLQIYKVLVLSRVSVSSTNPTSDADGNPPVGLQPLTSNIYSSHELRLLSWLNVNYHSMRKTVWEAGDGGDGGPPARWIVNFDLDVTDGLVFAALLAAYCPYMIKSHFQRMYTTATSLEQILHNNIIVTQALTALGLNINIQPTDLSDPNPVQMLILCTHLYERLPQYLPVKTVTLSGPLHGTLSKQVRLKNPASKPVGYNALLLGADAHLFSLPDGASVKMAPNSTSEVTVHFSFSFLQPKEATLLLVSSPAFGLCMSTLAFRLKTCLNHITATKTFKCKATCYQLKAIQLPISNIFDKEATFKVVLVESTSNPLEPDSVDQPYNTKIKNIPSDQTCASEVPDEEDCEFVSSVRSVRLGAGEAGTLGINLMPFRLETRYCCVLLVGPQVGDVVYLIKATFELPLPSPLSAKPSANVESPASDADTAVRNPAVRLRCQMGQVCEEVLRVPSINLLWESALAVWGQQCMSAEEHSRRMLTHTLHSSTVRVTTAWQKLCRQMILKSVDFKEVEYNVEVSLPQYFTLPHTVTIPIKEDVDVQKGNCADGGSVGVPLRFQANTIGKLECKVVLSSWCDTRVYLIEAHVSPQGNESPEVSWR